MLFRSRSVSTARQNIHHDARPALPVTSARAETIQPQITDIWERIRLNLSIDRHPEHPATRSKLEFYARKQEYLERVADRATPYIFHIVEELERRNMPLELALLPIVESAYQPFALSRSRASGIWQFIPSTGRRYGLKQNWWYDGRRDIIQATDAALNYLQKLHDDFNGDWLLALAAYNAGELNIARAMEKNLKAGKPADFWSLKLKKETMGYVPSLLAVAEIIADPAAYNITLKPIPNQAYFAVVDAGSQIDLATVAQLSGLSMDEIYTLNPGINKWATDPEGPFHLLIPLDISESFQQKLAALPPEQRSKWHTHKIRQGDTLGAIAAAYGTDINTIKQTNKLKSNLLRTGGTLIVPAAAGPLPQYTLSQASRSARQLQRSPDGQRLTYTITAGDTLWDISTAYDVSVEQLCEWNGITPRTILHPGNKLVVWSQAGMVPAAAKVATTTESAHITYTVRQGDSLWLIARRHGVSVQQLRQWNSLDHNDLLPGQNLDIYTGKPPADV